MRAMAIVGPVLAVVILIWGVVKLVNGAPGGGVLTTFGGAMLLVWSVLLSLAKRHKKI